MELLIDQLDVRYGSRVALERVTTRIGSGAITAVLGPNASGKSTLLKSISGFLRPTSGSVMLDGMRTDQMDGPCRARKIAYVPQR
ncbi:MAG: hypothetical protein CMJ32_12015, partial [Phycisphaerae bacterium]|nr:hypothetical protein [Phycisphaerae bacterium]